MAVVSKIIKHNVLYDELKIKGKSGIYCFLPYEQLDKQKKAVFKDEESIEESKILQ